MAKILVIDGSQSGSRAAQEHLEACGLSVETAQSGEGALAAVERGKPDMVLLDAQLSDMSGLQVCEALREKGHAFPVIVTSDSGEKSPWVDGLAQGFLLKPYTKAGLCATVQALLPGAGSPKTASWDSPMVLLHHLRNSVGSVSQIVDIFSKKGDENSRGKFVAMVQEAAKGSMALIEDYIELLKPLTLKPEDVQFDAWLKRVVSAHPISTAPQMAILLQNDAAAPPTIAGDPTLLGRAVDAVLTNALEAMSGGGTLTVKTYADARRGRVHVSFQDSGPGMEDYLLEHVLEPFFSMKKNKRGVGLSFAQKVARAHCGDIEVSSVPKEGTCVLLMLPVKGQGR